MYIAIIFLVIVAGAGFKEIYNDYIGGKSMDVELMVAVFICFMTALWLVLM